MQLKGKNYDFARLTLVDEVEFRSWADGITAPRLLRRPLENP